MRTASTVMSIFEEILKKKVLARYGSDWYLIKSVDIDEVTGGFLLELERVNECFNPLETK